MQEGSVVKQVGQVVCVKHTSSAKGSGPVPEKLQGQFEVHGYDAKLVPVRKALWDNQRIVAVYLDGTVKVESGDIWTVKPSGAKGAQWETVIPKEESDDR